MASDAVLGHALGLYDYAGASESELSFSKGDILVVYEEEGDDGWMEGARADMPALRGFFPSSYVEYPSSAGPAAAAPPPPPPQRGGFIPPPPPLAGGGGGGDGGGGGGAREYAKVSSNLDELDSFLEDEEEGDEWNFQAEPEDYGDEDYDQYAALTPVDPESALYIDESWRWQETLEYYVVTVSAPDKRKKYAGMKSYKAYTVSTPSQGWVVERRLKHFQWLRGQLAAKFPLIPIPVIPIKELKGEFAPREDKTDAISSFMEHVVRHPILRSTAVVEHFLSVSAQSNKKAWKDGKRRFEKDPISGRMFYRTVSPAQSPLNTEVPDYLDRFSGRTKAIIPVMSKTSSSLNAIGSQAGAMARVYAEAAVMFRAMAEGSVLDPPAFRQGVDAVSGCLAAIGAEYAKVAVAQDTVLRLLAWHTTVSKLSTSVLKGEYKARTKYIMSASKAAKKVVSTPEELSRINTQKELSVAMTSIAMAEVTHFIASRQLDFKAALTAYLQDLLEHHRSMVSHIENALGGVGGMPESAVAGEFVI